MKKAIMILLLGIVFVSGPAMAAEGDVQVTVTIEEADVDKLIAMIQDKYMHPGNFSCTNLSIKQCFVKMSILAAIEREYGNWKYAKDMKAAGDGVTRQSLGVKGE